MSDGVQPAVVGTNDTNSLSHDVLLKGPYDHLGIQVVQARRRFIQEQHAGLFDKGASNGCALLLSAKPLGQTYGLG